MIAPGGNLQPGDGELKQKLERVGRVAGLMGPLGGKLIESARKAAS